MTDLLTQDIVTWIDVCAVKDLIPCRGRAALLGEQQVALFRLTDGSVFALSNFDPFSQAYVISRGLVGSQGSVRKATSPVYKQNFNLETGECLDDPTVSLPTFPVRVIEGRIEVGLV